MKNESQPPDSMPSPKNRKPWPMWPIAVSILAFIVFYTWVQLKFRKVESPYEPSWSMRERTERNAEKNLYDWYSLSATQATGDPDWDMISISARKREAPLENELPSQIVYYLPRRPILAPSLSTVFSNETISSGEPLSLAIELPEDFAEDPSFHLTALYKEGKLILLAEMRVENEIELGSLDPNSPLKTVYLDLVTGPIQAGRVQVRLFSENQVFDWNLERL